MTNYNPNNSGYSQGMPSGNGNYAVMTPPPTKEKEPTVRLMYTAGGGLLVGIIAGLLLIGGSGDTDAVAATSETAPVEKVSETYGELAGTTKPAEDGDSAGETEAAAAGSEAGEGESETEAAAGETGDEVAETGESAEDSAAAEPPPAEPTKALLSFDVTPPEAIAALEIEVDGETVTLDGYEVSIEPDKQHKRVRITASAEGFRDFKQTLKVDGDTSVAVSMRKKAAPSSKPSNGGKNKGGKNKGGKGPGGLIQL